VAIAGRLGYERDHLQSWRRPNCDRAWRERMFSCSAHYILWRSIFICVGKAKVSRGILNAPISFSPKLLTAAALIR